MYRSFAVPLVAVALGLLGCAADPVVQESTTPTYTACSPITGTCVPGLECRGGLCLPPLNPDIGATDIGATDSGTTPAADTAGSDLADSTAADTASAAEDSTVEDVVEATPEIATPVDAASGEPDVVETPDVVDTPDPGVTPQPDECDFPGNPSTCPLSDVPGEFIYCRFEPTTANLACQTSPQFAFQFSTPCSTNTECDVSLGCHFGVCTVYCELGLAACPAETACVPIGHPKWGACKPLTP